MTSEAWTGDGGIRTLGSRLWLYRKGGWDGRTIERSGDEYGRRTLVLPLPGRRALVVAYRTCACDDCAQMRRQTAEFAADAQKVADHYGVTVDEAYRLGDDKWDAVLMPHPNRPGGRRVL